MPKNLKNYRDTEKKLNYRNRQRKINYDGGGFVKEQYSRGKYFTKDEDWYVIYSELKDREIAKIIKRSVHSIQKRRWLLLSKNEIIA